MPASAPSAAPSFRSRIGRDARSGHYAVPRRYRLHLALSCPHCLKIAVTHALLALDDVLPVTLLPAVPDAPDGGHRALRPLYETSSHQHPGPAAAPVLADDWTGRIVSTHAPDILDDLVLRFPGRDAGGPDLIPHGAEDACAAVGLCARDVATAARRAGQPGADPSALAALLSRLGALERRLASRPYMLGDALTLADVHVWVALLHLDTAHRRHLDAAAVHRIAEHPRLWAYARRLAAHPAFRSHLDPDGIVGRHRAWCRAREATGAAVQIVDWAAQARPRAAEPERRAG